MTRIRTLVHYTNPPALAGGCSVTPWVDECPLSYASHNAPKKVNALGSFLLSILAGHTRYAHITRLMGDSVNAKLLGMTKVISDERP